MTTALIVGGLLLLAVGLVSSQLFRLKDWLSRQPANPNPDPDPDPDDQAGPGPTAPPGLGSAGRVCAPGEAVDVLAHVLGDLQVGPRRRARSATFAQTLRSR